MWLPADESHPPRPDLPVLRHLTYTEAHAIELGGYIGLLLAAALALDMAGAALTFALAITRRATSGRKASGDDTPCEHSLGLHDARAEPHYFGFLAALIPLAYVAVDALAL